jgi:hypothetical protein
MSDIQSAHSDTNRDIWRGLFVVHIHENLLVTEVRSFLKLQVIIAEEGIIYRQNYQPVTAIFIFNVKAVFDISGLRHCAKIFQLQNKVIRHGVISFRYDLIDCIEALVSGLAVRIREVRLKYNYTLSALHFQRLD